MEGSRNCVNRMEEDGASRIHPSLTLAVNSPIRTLELAIAETGWAGVGCGAEDGEGAERELINQAMAIPPARMIPYVKSFCSDKGGYGTHGSLFIGMI